MNKNPTLRTNLLLAMVLVLGTSVAPVTASAAQEAPLTVRWDEARLNLIGSPPVIRAAWVDLTRSSGGAYWTFRITVDAQGKVTQALLNAGSAERRKEAKLAVKGLMFKPFERDGRAVPARFDYTVYGESEDYVGPVDRAFPQNIDPKQVHLSLRRTACFGPCPQFWVELRGDGQVSYRGAANVVAEGEHHWRIAPAAAAQLIERFRAADYFKLDGYYHVDTTDLSTQVTRLSVGSQQKFVFNYGGELMGQFPDTQPPMPKAVTELEDAIETVSGAISWVRGDENTMDRLRAAHWNFRSQSAGRGLAQLIGDCKIGLATDFIRAGAPVNIVNVPWYGDSVAWWAAACGNLGLVRLLESKGALRRPKDARIFLVASVASGYSEMVAIALKHDSDVRHPDADGTPLLSLASRAYVRRDDAPADTAFDPVKVIAQLLAAGADPNAKDRDGETPLEAASSEATALALLAAGASAPTDRERLSKLINEATKEQWTQLLPVLLRAASPGPSIQTPFSELKPRALLHVGKTADWVAITDDAVWTGSTGPNAVHHIDPGTDQLVASVMLPGEPCAGLATGFGALWVPICGDKPGLAKVDLKTNRLIEVLPFGPAAEEGGVATSADSVWIVTDKLGSLARIDPMTGQLRQTVRLPAGSFNLQHSDGIVFVTQVEGASLSLVDAATGAVLASVPTGPNPRFLTTGDGSVWTLNQGDGTLTRVDVETRKAVATIALNTPGHGGDIAFHQGKVWTTMSKTPLSVTDASTNQVLHQWVGPGGDSLAVGHGAIWITDYKGGTIARIPLQDTDVH